MLNNVICNEFCHSLSGCGFSSKCSDLGLKFSSHCICLDPLQSFKHVIHPLVGISELTINQMIANLFEEDNFNLKSEYGGHRRWIVQGMCPNMALLSKISFEYEIDVFVVCGDLPLRSIHKGRRLLRFSCNNELLLTSQEKDSLRQNSRKIIIGLGGIGIYHPIDQPHETDILLWNSFYDRSVFIDNTESIEETGTVPTVVAAGENIAVDDFIEDIHVASQEIESNVLENSTSPYTSRSIKEFIENNSLKIDNNLKILPSAYSCSDKIEMSLSNDEALLDGDGLFLNQSYDIDGFFAFSDSKLMAKALKLGASININHNICDKRTVKNIKAIYSYKGIRLLNSTFFTKIAATDHNVVKF